MKRPLLSIALLAAACLAAMPSVGADDQAARVLARFFDAAGGLALFQNLRSASATARIDAYAYEYDLSLLADGRFRVEAPDRVTVHDGQGYWQTFHGVVGQLTGEELEQYEEISLRRLFCHDFLDEEGQPAIFEYAGQESRRGQTWDLITTTTPDGDRRTFYLNAGTGLLDKMVELTPDPDFRELKNIYTYAEYDTIAGFVLPTAYQGQCITNGEPVQPLTRFADIRFNEDLDEMLFAKPEGTVPSATFADGALGGEVVAISRGGSLITNITMVDIEQLAPADGDTLVSQVKGHETRLEYMPSLEDSGPIAPGDYLATFNRTPCLWLVRAYEGMISDDSTYAAGDKVRLTAQAGN